VAVEACSSLDAAVRCSPPVAESPEDGESPVAGLGRLGGDEQEPARARGGLLQKVKGAGGR